MAASSWRLRRGGELDQFFTSDAVGRGLVKMVGNAPVGKVLDLGVGAGSLSFAALSEWPQASLVSVDLDEKVEVPLRRKLMGLSDSEHSHLVFDVFDETLPDKVGQRDFDLAVCNPPFFQPIWRPSFTHILSDAGLADFASEGDISAEVVFLAQNLRMVREGALVALIVPNGIAVGHKFRRLRRALMKVHKVVSVAQLPPYSFENTEAHCYIMLIEKGAPQGSDPIKLIRFNSMMECERAIEIGPDGAVDRMDYDFHSVVGGADTSLETLRSLGADIRRGSFSSVARRQADFPVFHTGDFATAPARLSLPMVASGTLPERVVVAESGDILLARVDRFLHDKIALVQDGHCPITDCIFRLRLPREEADRVFSSLSTIGARERIKATVKGVGARVLGKGDLLDLPLIHPPSIFA